MVVAGHDQGGISRTGKYRRQLRSRGAQSEPGDETAERGLAQDLREAIDYPAFTRFNVFLRDRFSCQYCGTRDDLTFDHLLPRSRGGHTTWDNVVAACSACNLRKGSLTTNEAKMWPSQMPFQPTVHHLHRNGRLFPPNYLHESWLDYLYWDTELEP